MNRGFTLIEIMVVASITVLFASLLVQNFSKSRTDLGQAAVLAGDAVREAQSMALSGIVRGDTLRCGYGISFRADGYDIYAGPSSEDPCPTAPDRGEVGTQTVRSAALGSQALEVTGLPADVFFEPPTPTVYFNGSTAFESREIRICRKGTTDCRIITVYASGIISTTK